MDDNPRTSGYWWSIVAMFVLAGALLATAIVLLTDRPQTTTVSILPPPPTATESPTSTPAPISVYVIGAVVSETVVQVPADARIMDVIAAVGGALPNADLRSINLAAPVVDGQMIAVPFQSDTADATVLVTVPPPTQSQSNNAPLVNLNTATIEELETVSGIGPVTAQNIIDYRDANGPFTSVDDLINVTRIGPTTLENLRPYLTVE